MAVGVNVKLTVQLAPAERLDAHVVVRAKSPMFVPVKEVARAVSVAVPTFLNVTTCAALDVLII